MLIYRIEHDRKLCDSMIFGQGGLSPSGHGCQAVTDCTTVGKIPPVNFGGCGPIPLQVQSYERCAVTVEQFPRWIAGDVLRIADGWVIMAYRVHSAQEDIDWRYNNDQITFNPAYALLVGEVTIENINSQLTTPIQVGPPVNNTAVAKFYATLA